MLDFTIAQDAETNEFFLETSVYGKALLTIPQLNKSTAFTLEERHTFGLMGKLPHQVETLDDQVKRAYLQFSAYKSFLQQNIYLNNLHDKNQVLFYKLLSRNLAEMLPVIYTPIVGKAVKHFSHEYRQPRGLYITYKDIDLLDEILSNRTNPEIDLIVVTDGEGVLGIGDQGIGGMDIPVAKLMVYSLCGGIDPTRTLPIFLDVGTNNEELLADPMYLGLRHRRIEQDHYYRFISRFVEAIKRNFPTVFLHWEDFGRSNARKILDQFQAKLCTFNDDIQGTGAVTLAALLAACNITDSSLADQRILVFGAGSAGTGISDQILEALIRQGLSYKEATERFWLIDRQGLLLTTDTQLTDAQKPYAKDPEAIKSWALPVDRTPSLHDTVNYAKPTILIGCSAQPGAFSQEIIETMTLHCERPIIFPLSNPDERCEAQPSDILNWSQGRALVATGTAFPAVEFQNKIVQIAQCNNALVFPGIGLGILAVKASRCTTGMLWAATETLAHFAPSKKDSFLPLLPSLDDAKIVAKAIAVAVAKEAIAEGLAKVNHDHNIEELVESLYWEPRYLPFRRKY